MLLGCVLAAIFVTDQLVGPQEGANLFPWLHTKLTLNYSYRGLWGTIACILVLFLVSSFTKKTDAAALEQLTVSWRYQREPFRGLQDWRLQWAALTVITIVLYWVLR